jgi:hypothetical protein
VGNSAGTTAGAVFFNNTLTVDGTGSFLLGGSSNNVLWVFGGVTATLGSSLTVHGKNGSLNIYSGVGNYVNLGTIKADVSGGTIQISLVTNSGTLKAQGGGTLNLNSSWINTGGTFSADGGTFNILSPGTNTTGTTDTIEAKNGGTVNIMNSITNTGATMLLTGNGSFGWVLGEMIGGTVTEINGAVLTEAPGSTGNQTLRGGVTLNGNLDLSVVSSQMFVYDGLTLNGTIILGNSTGTTSGTIIDEGDLTIDGTGDIILGGSTANQVVNPGTVTFGPNLKVHGKNGRLSYAQFSGGAIINKLTF